ncbi:MAG: hypothetical protein CMJ34_11960 [Phycisphaerae bacterium]|nr:hypothetical protein [Phycisphaerae bacterium]
MHASASNRPRLLPRLGVCLTGTMVALILGGQAAPAEEPPEPPSPSPVEADDAAPSSTPPAAEAPPRRVHIWVDRYEEIGGEVVEEDDVLLSIRTPDDQIRTFTKSRLIYVIPLLELPEPRSGLVELRDGSVLSGELIEDGYETVVLRIEGVLTTLPRESVVRTRFDLSLEEKYRRFRESIEPDQYLRRLDLARWLCDEKAYKLSERELVEIVAESQLPEAIELLRMVKAQIALEEGTRPEGRSIERPPSMRDSGTVDLKDMLPSEVISGDDVNLMRVYEIDFRSPPPRVHVAPQVIRDLLETYGASPLIPGDSSGRTRLFRADPMEIVDLMFKLKAREFYPRIEVKSEPPSLNLFRQRVHDAWIIPNCATSRCHGGLDGGRLFLHRRGSKSERVRYTNLLILERWNELGQPLIDWEDPERSLIIQYGLPRNDARFPHPDVKGWRPVFTPGNHRVLRDSLRWIESMYRPRPGYPVEYEAPVLEIPVVPASEDGENTSEDGRRDR